MKRKRFKEEQIIGILREAEAGGVPQARDSQGNLLPLEEQTRRDGGE
jgi:hypothetical protein